MILIPLVIVFCSFTGIMANLLVRFMGHVWPLDPAEYLRRTPRPYAYLGN